MIESVELRRSRYADSVSLMQASRTVSEVPGVSGAFVAMATGLNLELLADMGFTAPAEAGPNDLLVAVRASDDAARDAALAQLDETLAALSTPPIGTGALGNDPAPRTTAAAAGRLHGATLALVSVPGPSAFAEAIDALEAGLSVLVFSDNVPVEQEIALKEEAARYGLLAMGPDCGTAIIGGVGLGFANVVRPGSIGVVAASGTGAQQLTCLLDTAGVGVSSLLGVGGRDLSSRVAGRSTLRAMRALDADPATDLIVVVSKPPATEVASAVRQQAEALQTPVLLGFLGVGQDDLTALAEQVVSAVGGDVPGWPSWPRPTEQRPRSGALRGLFAGGTLCDEAMVIASETLGPIRSNIPLTSQWALPRDLRADGHLMIDFGDDRLTSGRPHPMIDLTLRLHRLVAEAADPACAVILLDVVLGFGSHPDPASELAPAIRSARETAAAAGRNLAVVVSLCGTAGDPQGFARQASALSTAGARVYLSNATAARAAVALLPKDTSP